MQLLITVAVIQTSRMGPHFSDASDKTIITYVVHAFGVGGSICHSVLETLIYVNITKSIGSRIVEVLLHRCSSDHWWMNTNIYLCIKIQIRHLPPELVHLHLYDGTGLADCRGCSAMSVGWLSQSGQFLTLVREMYRTVNMNLKKKVYTVYTVKTVDLIHE